MSWLLDLSFRYKIPLWGSILIVAATLAVSAALMAQAYDDLKEDLLTSSANLGRTLAKPLFQAMLNDEVWRAFEIIKAPLHGAAGDSLIQPEMIFILDKRQRVFVSSQPKSMPMLADAGRLGEEYVSLANKIAARPQWDEGPIEHSGAHLIYVAVPIGEEGARQGTLVIVHSKDAFLPRFRALAWHGAVIGLVVLAVLLPINWHWGQRTAVPLVRLAHCIGEVARGVPPAHPPDGTYVHQDEVGRLYEAYGLMVRALQEKTALEREVIRSERLAAVGRLSAGIAHEINNPLGGMLVALSNFKRRGGHDERTLNTMAMLERGLTQIRDTVSAMLVEAKLKSRDFTPQDVDDIATLLAAEMHKRAVSLSIDSNVEAPIPLPATLLRQVLINLLLNAIQASEPSGTVRCTIRHETHNEGVLTIRTENGGRPIPPEVMAHLFEPFTSGGEAGSGLGLWVTYQIVSQLGGQIMVESGDGLTRFQVVLPTGERQ